MAQLRKTQTHSNPLIAPLNQSLAGMIDLKLQAKQAHWNVKGANFIALHELFDRVSGEVDGLADMIAERAVQLGGLAQGTLQDVSKNSRLPAYPGTTQDARRHILAVGAALSAQADLLRRGIDAAEKHGDKVTADLFTEAAGAADKLRWLVESHA